MIEVQKKISHLSSVLSYFNKDISHLSTMRLKSYGHYCTVGNTQDLQMLLQIFTDEKINYKMIGWGANQILPQDATDHIYIKLLPPKDVENLFPEHEEQFLLPAGIGLNTLISKALERGFIGWEVLTGIPASLGGATFMNAGTKFGDISTIISAIHVMTPAGNIKKITNEPSIFSYRKNHFLKSGEIIVNVEIIHRGIDKKRVEKQITEYMDYRKKTQPLQSNNCGCIFKNLDGVSAGKIIDDLGLKGLCVGPMRVSSVHGNFLENQGGATAEQFWELVKLIQEKVKTAHGKEFELEICS